MNAFILYQDLLSKYISKEIIWLLQNEWNKPHRFYHNVNHLNDILTYINSYKYMLNTEHYDALILAAFFHDAYYETKNNINNEDESIKRFLSSYNHTSQIIKNFVVLTIESTKHRKRPDNILLQLFWDADNDILNKDYKALINYESLIRKEYIHIDKQIYKKKRIAFLQQNLKLFDTNKSNLLKLVKYIEDSY